MEEELGLAQMAGNRPAGQYGLKEIVAMQERDGIYRYGLLLKGSRRCWEERLLRLHGRDSGM